MIWKWLGIMALLLFLFEGVEANQAPPKVTVDVKRFGEGTCSGTFVAHDLPHITTVKSERIRLYESNGSGLGINDLNGDGLQDIVLANLDGPSTLLWNEGDLNFRKTEIDLAPRRDVNLVDVNGDGLIDIVLTGQATTPALWQNVGNELSKLGSLKGVSHLAYSMDWADVDRDGDLDLVTASYDADLEKTLKDSFLLGGGAGVFYYENRDGQFVGKRLANKAQALTVFMNDFNDDGQLDLAVGNDFAFPDQYWTFDNGQWMPFQPFMITTYSTMSFDAGDINNDGQSEFFATDMQPYSTDPQTQKQWQPLLEQLMKKPRLTNDPQTIENILQRVDTQDGYTNIARTMGLSATGWSWSAQFGDLNSDGYLDLYVVNGMIALELFGQLPNSELVEENQARRNLNGTRFVPAPEWQLNSTRSGRGMTMADMDNDGDLDIVVNNLMSAAQLFENQLCEGHNLIVQLRQPAIQNHDQIGARIILHTATGTYQRQIRASSGYLSGNPTQVHFGLPDGSQIEDLEVQWTDGVISHLSAIQVDTLLTVARE
ncbi:MAG: CRTAC1 family protein [Anaerolineae bacterium]